ncbi:MAG: error-prone DNA polymerase [Pseudorhodobacter sp.]|nr:error-prone DNA polymerase [Rhizobacter sp.]
MKARAAAAPSSQSAERAPSRPRQLPRQLPNYAELHARSNFTFLTGASHPEELVARAARLGYSAIAITDECSLAGVVRAHGEAKRAQLHLIVGAEMRLTLPQSMTAHARLVLLAQTRRGYGNLSHWITVARRRAEKGHYLAHPGDVEGKVPNAPMLTGLPDCLALLVPSPQQTFEEVFAHAMWLKTWFQQRASIALELLHRAGDDELVDTVLRVAQFTGLRVVASGDVLMHLRSRKPLQDTLTATRLNLPLSECGMQLQPNAEQHLRSRGRLSALYQPEWLDNTLLLAGQCGFSLDELRYEYPQEIVPEGETPKSYLRTLTEQGALRRYPPPQFPGGIPPKVRAQLEHELALIAQMDYERYFLTVADIVHWARSQKILCQGRGSAANSAVCYCLEVTAIDPERSTLLFERFISVERNEPPDIDIDFEHQRREEVIQYIYKKYGRHRAALAAVVISYRPKSALRDAGRALGIDLQRIEAVAKSQQWFDGKSVSPQRLSEHGFDVDAPITKLWAELTHQLIGFPRHLSQHPGGFVIAREHMSQLVPVENATMKDRSVIQWDKDDLQALGLMKVDILALGMLSALRRSLEFISQKLQRPFELHEVPDKDAATYDMACRGDTVGVFQIESRAQMSMLPRLKPRVFYDLVVQVAIVRPGPIQGGMVHPYLRRRSGQEPVVYPSGEIKQALERTLGVPIFQEQVMQIAMLAADFTPGEADSLRRAMAAWKRKGGLVPFHERLVNRMVEKGYDLEFAESIFKQIQGFGEYGFPESHASSFALLAYDSSWIKCHHPDAFLAGLLNSQPMGFYAPAQLVRDAREHGVDVLPVDVRVSGWDCALEIDEDAALSPVRLGLNRISGLSEASAQRIVQAREQGAFINIEDLTRRALLNAHDLHVLADANALDGMSGHRHQAAWAVAGIDTRPTALLRDSRVSEEIVPLAAPNDAENMLADYRSLGLTLNAHPLSLLRETLNTFKVQTARVLRSYPDGRIARASGIVTHRQRPGTAKGVVFVTLEDDTGTVNVIVWPTVADAQRVPLLAARLMTVFGTWQSVAVGKGNDDHAVMHLLASKIIDHSTLLGGLIGKSRDFR